MQKTKLVRMFALTAVLALAITFVSLRGTAMPSEAAVNRLQYSIGCAPNGGASVAFYWYGTSPTARQVWLDVSQSLSYWEPGTFTNAGPFGPNDGYYEWRGLPAGSTIYVRVNQQL